MVMGNVLISLDEAKRIKARLKNDARVAAQLDSAAKGLLSNKLYTVTEYQSPADSGNPHDYFSEGPYWWPNPKDPNGPYIRRDGEFNPDLFEHHREDMTRMSHESLLLAIAGFYLDNAVYAERAYQLLYTWFIDEDTCMTPHLEHGQAIRGLCSGRGIGIIDTVTLIDAVQAAWYLEQMGYYDTLAGCRAWFTEYLHWLNTSEKGLSEKHYFNNHANWWNSQAAAYAAYVGDEAMLAECVDKFKNDILPRQMGSEGEFVDEIKRTNSLHYSLYNLDAGGVMCEIAQLNGYDLWHYQTADGKGMELALRFILPYLKAPETWPYPQINKIRSVGENPTLQVGAMRLQKPVWTAVNRQNRSPERVVDSSSHAGPVYFLAGYDYE